MIDAVGKPSEQVMELCRISIAGDSFSEVVRPVDDEIKERFSDAYRRWKANDQTISGHRLEDWTEAGLSTRSIRDMADLNIRSVEDLAGLADIHVSRIIDGRSLRRRAQEWLEAHPSRQEESEIAALRKQNQELLMSRGGREDCRKIGVSCRCQKEGDRIAAAEGRESDADRRRTPKRARHVTLDNPRDDAAVTEAPSRDAPMTDAERARRYREKKKAASAPVGLRSNPILRLWRSKPEPSTDHRDMLAGDLPAAALNADAERPIAATRSDVASVDISRPPKRLRVRSKTIWQTIAPELREDIILREQEFDRAFFSL